MSTRLAWLNYVCAAAGILVLIPTLTLFLNSGNDPKYIPVMIGGEILSVLGMLVFTVSVLRELFRARPAGG